MERYEDKGVSVLPTVDGGEFYIPFLIKKIMSKYLLKEKITGYLGNANLCSVKRRNTQNVNCLVSILNRGNTVILLTLNFKFFTMFIPLSRIQWKIGDGFCVVTNSRNLDSLSDILFYGSL